MSPEVCDNCGGLASAHPRSAEPDGLTAALWKILLAEGGVWSYYGGGFVKAESRKDAYQRGVIYHNEMAKIDIHMTACEIDWKETRRPTMDGELLEFAGTGYDSQRITGKLFGQLFCKCDEYSYEEIGMDDITLGQLIWRVVHADDVT